MKVLGCLMMAALTGAAPTYTLRSLYGLAPPRALQAAKTAVVLVDFQQEFFTGRLPLPRGAEAVASAVRLVAWARASGILVVHVRNVVTRSGSPAFDAGSPTVAFVPALTPHGDDLVVTKALAGAFSRTDLDVQLRQRGVDTLIVGGLMTHLAVAITASDATVLGYHTVVVADATATRALPAAGGAPAIDEATLQRAALATLADRTADVLTAEAIMRLPLSGRSTKQAP
jgi:nicotinamidase-related amidase